MKLFFYDNTPRPRVLAGDFAKGLANAAANKEALQIEKVAAGIEPDDGGYTLQLCGWHGVEAIKRHLMQAGQYNQEWRLEIVDLIWLGVKSETIEGLEERRETLLQQLKPEEQAYLTRNYQPKEHQFVRAYNQRYANLGVNSTARAEGYREVIKVCKRQFTSPQSVKAI